MTKQRCKNCGFRTERENLKKCPYCDANALEKEQSAEELIKDNSI